MLREPPHGFIPGLRASERRGPGQVPHDDEQVPPRQSVGAELVEPQAEGDEVVLDGLPVLV